MERHKISREAYDGDDEDLARTIDDGIAGMAKQEAARRRFDEKPAKWAAKARAARRAERGDR